MDNYENNQNYQGYTPDDNAQPQQTYQAQPQQTYQPQQYNAQPYQAEVQPQKEKDNKAIASLVLGIVSILCCNPLFATSIVGIVMGIQSKKANPDNNTMATVGIILSAVGIVFGIIGIIVGVIMIINGQNASRYAYHYSYY